MMDMSQLVKFTSISRRLGADVYVDDHHRVVFSRQNVGTPFQEDPPSRIPNYMT